MEVAIIGGGVAGILAARAFKQQGFSNLTLFEAGDSLGGVWSDGYPNYGIQTPGRYYEFPDKELPSPKDYIDGKSIKTYCEDYVREHDLSQFIRLNSRVCSIEKEEQQHTNEKDENKTKWRIALVDGTSRVFDFVVLATGIYSPNLKHIPKIEGLEHFGGKICHSQDTGGLNNNGQRLGKRVIVVGFGKSAHDCAMNAFAETGVPPTILFRSSHWCVSRHVLGFIPAAWLILSRAAQGLAPKWHECGPVEYIVHTFLYPLIWLYWRLAELIFTLQQGLYGSKGHLRPTLNIENDMFCGHGIFVDPNFFPMVHRGDIKAIKGSIERILPSGKVQLSDGTEHEADELVFATGFRRTFDFLPKELLDKKEEDGFYAYRHMLVPGVPNVAFLNSNVTTSSNITTPAIQAVWLAQLLKGEFDLPSDMEARVQAEKAWRRKRLTHAGESRAILVQAHQLRYFDSLLSDMGINVKRKTSSLGPFVAAFKTFFAPMCSSDYKTVITGEWQAKHSREVRRKGYTPCFLFEWSVLFLAYGVLLCLWMLFIQCTAGCQNETHM